VNGLANALEAVATLLVMCDARDLGRAVGENRIQGPGFRIQDSGAGDQSDAESKIQNLKSKIGESKIQNLKSKIFEPNIYLYDKYPGGVGLSEPLFRLCDSLLEKTLRLISNCPCASGCPSCVGPMGEVGEKGKEVALEILRRLCVVRGP
jgi:DEAD/DEAH box helicase domain-containing protein